MSFIRGLGSVGILSPRASSSGPFRRLKTRALARNSFFCNHQSWQATMPLNRISSVLPIHSDPRTSSKHGHRSCFYSRRVQYAIAFIVLLIVSLLLFARPPGPPPPYPPIFEDDIYDAPAHPGLMPPPRVTSPPVQTDASHSDLWRTRAEKVKDAFVRGYSAYYSIAFPHDELLPKTNGTRDK